MEGHLSSFCARGVLQGQTFRQCGFVLYILPTVQSGAVQQTQPRTHSGTQCLAHIVEYRQSCCIAFSGHLIGPRPAAKTILLNSIGGCCLISAWLLVSTATNQNYRLLQVGSFKGENGDSSTTISACNLVYCPKFALSACQNAFGLLCDIQGTRMLFCIPLSLTSKWM